MPNRGDARRVYKTHVHSCSNANWELGGVQNTQLSELIFHTLFGSSIEQLSRFEVLQSTITSEHSKNQIMLKDKLPSKNNKHIHTNLAKPAKPAAKKKTA